MTFEYIPGGDLQVPLEAGVHPNRDETRGLLMGC